MARLFTLFLLFQLLLFAIELWHPLYYTVIRQWTLWLTGFCAELIGLIDDSVASIGNLIMNRKTGFAVAVEAGCNGVEATLIFMAAILALSTPWKHKLVGLISGAAAAQGLNVVRVVSVYYLGQWHEAIFEWAHLYVWQAMIMLDALLFFLLWLRWLPAVPNTAKAAS